MPYNTSTTQHNTQTTKPDTTRCSHPLCNTQHTTTPQPTHNHHHTHQRGCVRQPRPGAATQENHPPTGISSGPNSMPNSPFTPPSAQKIPVRVPPSHTPNNSRAWKLQEGNPQRDVGDCLPQRGKLLRKEVIQPHLPVRLPCYDFVPIAGPTFDHSPPTRGLGHGLRVLPTFVT